MGGGAHDGTNPEAWRDGLADDTVYIGHDVKNDYHTLIATDGIVTTATSPISPNTWKKATAVDHARDISGQVRRYFGNNRQLGDLTENESVKAKLEPYINGKLVPLGAMLDSIKHAYLLKHDIPVNHQDARIH